MPVNKTSPRRAPMFDDTPPPAQYRFDRDERIGDGASVGFRLLCLNKAIDFAESGAKTEDVVKSALQIRQFLLGEHPAEAAIAAAVAAKGATQH